MPQPSWNHYILLVEDDHSLRDLYRTALRDAGYAVIGVEDGLDALKVIDIGKPRAIVLDLALPRLGGRDVTRELLSNDYTRRIPVVIVSGGDVSDLDPAQFACILKKPIDADDLVRAVDKCLRRGAAR